MPDPQYPNFTTQAPSLGAGAIPTYPTPAVAPIASNPLNTYSQVVGTQQATQNMRNQSQQMKRDQIAFQEQQAASRAKQIGMLKPGTADFDNYQKTNLLPGEQPHQSFLQAISASPIAQALAHGMHALSGLVHHGQGAIPAAPVDQSAPTPGPTDQGTQGPPSPAAAPPVDTYEDGGVVQKFSGWDLAKQAVKEAHDAMFGENTNTSAPLGSGGAQQAAGNVASRTSTVDSAVDDMSKMRGGPITDNKPRVAPQFMQPPTVGDPPGHQNKILAFSKGGAIPHYADGGAVLNTFAESGAGNISKDSTPGAGNSPTPDSGVSPNMGNLSSLAGLGGAGGTADGVAGGAGVGAGAGTGADAAAGAASGIGSALAFFENGGEVPGNGVVSGGQNGLKGFAEGGEVQGPPSPVQAQAHFVQAAEDSAAHLHSLALDDSGQPGNAQGVPSTGPVPVPGVNAPDAPPTATQGSQAGAPAAPGASGGSGTLPYAADRAAANAKLRAGGYAVKPGELDYDQTAALPGAADRGLATARAAAAADKPGAPLTPAERTGTAAVVKAAATDSVALGGQVSTTPAAEGKPRSISMDDWEKSDQLINRAAMSAAAAGHDGAAVAESLNANRNAWVQGHVLRWLSVANTRSLANDQDGVVSALKNAYYYIPDGQDLKVQKDKDGNVVFEDPIDPKNADGTPVMRPVNQQTLQMMGTAMLDPMNVNNLIITARSSAAKVALEQAQATAALRTGSGNYYRGLGIYNNSNAKNREVDANNYLHLSEGDKNRALASYFNNKVIQGATTNGRLDPTLAHMGQQAGAEYDNIALGRQTVVPTQIPDARNPGRMVPNTDPNAGKVTRDTSQVPAALKNITPEQHAANKATASDIAISNGGTISPARAAQIVTQIQIQRGMTHPGPDGKPQRDVLIDNAQGTGHVWDTQSKSWINFRLHPNTAQNIQTNAQPDPVEVMAAINASSGGGSGVPREVPDPEENAPDMEPPPVSPGT
jgi:hypothetical protein